MLGSFLRHGLTQREAQTELVFQVYIRLTEFHVIDTNTT
jgi:hypothetical protein